MTTLWFRTPGWPTPAAMPVDFSDEQLQEAGLPNDWSGGAVPEDIASKLLDMTPHGWRREYYRVWRTR